MNLYTSVDLPDNLPRITQNNHLLLMGSCFSVNMGQLLVDAKFPCDINPFGVLYNPLSISTALREIAGDKIYSREDLFFYRECWHSSMHHSDFSSPDMEETLQHINARLAGAREEMPRLDCILLTFGTAWVYEDNKTSKVVGNCHKRPESAFTRRRLSVEEIVTDYSQLFSHLLEANAQLKFMITVSPIRHARDGMHENQLSKATLLLAAERLQTDFPGHVFYFPAYELLMDELRDYRFYAEDLVHPSSVAIQYVWEKFAYCCFTKEALLIMDECENIRKSLEHKPFHPESEGYKRFLEQIVLKMEQLNQKYPYLDFQKERDLCHIRLQK